MKVGITRDQLSDNNSDNNNDNNSTVFTITASVLIMGVITIIIVVTVCVMRKKKQKSRRYVCTSSNNHIKSNVDIGLSYRNSNIHAREMHSKTNSTIYENVENDTSAIEMCEDPNSVHVYEVFEPHSPGQSDATYKNPSADGEEITKAEISNPASTFQPKARENPYVLDTSRENTSSTTT